MPKTLLIVSISLLFILTGQLAVAQQDSVHTSAPSALAFEMHPNPADDFVLFVFDTPVSHSFQISIMTLTGHHVKTIVSESPSQTELRMPLSDVEEGIYFVKMLGEDQQMVRRLIIRHH